MIRAIFSTAAITLGGTLLGASAGGILAGQLGAELGLIIGGVLGLAIGFRYNADMAAVAAAQREWNEAHPPERHAMERRSRQDPFGETSRRVYLRDRRGEFWRALAVKRRERSAGSRLARYTSQRHHDLELSDIGIRRKSKPKRR
ncbi:MAG: hypothetical protein OXE52_05620 [Chloroflexi bacterium]|nr:hypothetical protein [Chloroflexota bacterium]